MTEKEEKASEKILKAIADLEAKISLKPPEKHEEAEMSPWEHVHTCPTCKPKLDKEKEDYAKEYVQKEGFIKPFGKRDRHEYEKMCRGCGLRGKKDEEKCPSCGSTDYY